MTGTSLTWSHYTHSGSEWQQLLDRYCEYELRYKRLLQWRAIGYATLIYSLTIIIFLLGSASHYHSYWLMAALSGIVAALPLSVYCQHALNVTMRDRNALSRELFNAGLRVDEEYHLLTNSAHPRLIASKELRDER